MNVFDYEKVGYMVPDLITAQSQHSRRDGKKCLKIYPDLSAAKRAIGLVHPKSSYNTAEQNAFQVDQRRQYKIHPVFINEKVDYYA